MSQALNRQKQIYIRGLAGKRERIPLNYQDLEALARKRMSKRAFAYVAGGAGTEHGITANRTTFEEWFIQPRVLNDVSDFDLSVDLFGHDLQVPLLLAPIGVLELAHPAGELPVARTAADMNIPLIFSNQASVDMETCAREMGQSPRWFQLYWSKSDELVASFLKRAEDVGCSAIVVTLDTPLLGWRLRDLELGYLPFLEGRGIAQYTSDPVFRRMVAYDEPDTEIAFKPPVTIQTILSVLGLMRRYPGGFWNNLRSKEPLKAVKTFINTYTRTNLTWDDLTKLRDMTALPILLKGILHPVDARKAAEAGMDGIIVSNHGGRQIDSALSPLRVLPEIRAAVPERYPVLMDSGIRTGADVFKALALGADAVCVGRPYVYGLAVDGEKGVRAVLENIISELELTMRLAGVSRVTDINDDRLIKSGDLLGL